MYLYFIQRNNAHSFFHKIKASELIPENPIQFHNRIYYHINLSSHKKYIIDDRSTVLFDGAECGSECGSECEAENLFLFVLDLSSFHENLTYVSKCY